MPSRIYALSALILIFQMFFAQARAQYPSAKPNFDIREENSTNRNSVISGSEQFAFAVDGETFYRALGSDDFYHGIGYWVQGRSEARPTQWMRANLRSVLYAGSCSTGYAEPSGSYHLFALTGVFPDPVLGSELRLRTGDLDRQSLGEGLLIQDREMNGVSLSLIGEEHSLIFRGDGTGLLRMPDDSLSLEARLYSGLIGIGALYWTQGVKEDFLAKNREPYHFVFSRRRFGWFSYGLEGGAREGAAAALLALKAQQELGAFKYEIKLEGRRYAAGFANDFKGRIQQQYISYDQYDEDFTNAANVFVVDDDVNVGAAHIKMWWNPSGIWRLHSLNELGRFEYKNQDVNAYYFFRHGVSYCPLQDRDDCISFFTSNKVLVDSFARPPAQRSMSNSALFRMVPFVGVEGRFRF